MVLKYALVLTRGGLPVTSFDFTTGGVQVDEVLFSGFISAIQPFLREIEDGSVHDDQIGEISTGNTSILYYYGHNSIGVLVGKEFDETFRNKLVLIINEFEEKIAGYIDDYFHIDDERLMEAISALHKSLILSFQEEAIHEYLIPVMRRYVRHQDIENMTPKLESFIGMINGRRTLMEITDALDFSWTQTLVYTSQLLAQNVITFKVEYNDERILQLTQYGLDLLFNRSEVPLDLIEDWKSIVIPFISEIDNQRSLSEIKGRIKKKIKKHGEQKIDAVIKELMFRRIIMPASDIYQLGKFLQSYYLKFYGSISKRVGRTGQKLFFNRIEEAEYIRSLLPDFENDRVQSLDKFYFFLKSSTRDEKIEFIHKFAEPVKHTIDDLKKLMGNKSLTKVTQSIWVELEYHHKLLIKEYKINEIFML